jgi:hypothetical protein
MRAPVLADSERPTFLGELQDLDVARLRQFNEVQDKAGKGIAQHLWPALGPPAEPFVVLPDFLRHYKVATA